MEDLSEMLVPVELKYCERCGGLWLRSKDEEEVYCPGCVPKMAEFPPPRRKRVIVVQVESVDEIQACLAELAGVRVWKEATRDGRGGCNAGGTNRPRRD
jgi:Zn-finger nucleic acid-binding protein